MPSLSTFADPKSYHILIFGILFGSNLFQTFLAGPLAFKALPRPQFSTLQQAIFPPYFAVQTVLPVVLALTWPGEKIVAAGEATMRRHPGANGLLQDRNLWTALIPIVLMFVTSALNMLFLGPATTKVMRERKHQETRDGKKYFDPGPKSAEMQRLNKSFATLHGIASLANLIGTGAMVVYGFTLGEML